MPEPQSTSRPDSFFSDRYARKPLPQWVAWGGVALIIIAIVMSALWAFWWRPPREFPPEFLLAVPEGATLSQTASRLSGAHLIRSRFWFKVFGVLSDGEHGVKAGEYLFSEPETVLRLARRLTHGDYKLAPARITIPEGTNNKQLAALLKRALPRFSGTRFLELAKGKEGYLFPDTYLFLPNASEDSVIAAMEGVFEKRLAPLASRIGQFGRPFPDVINMAALLEEEARTMETRQKVAGILWKRLEKGMPLQVDGVFPYIFGDKPYDLTDGDLLVDSPYNTYKYTGLPPTPISNPGLAAIRAAITPITTPYWFYLSDKDGTMHYAVSHEEHLINRTKYLGK